MGLVARELEGRGITTVCLMLLEEVARKVKPPRSLFVEFGWGQPLGPPGAEAMHRDVAEAALRMLETTEPAALRTFRPGGSGWPPDGTG